MFVHTAGLLSDVYNINTKISFFSWINGSLASDILTDSDPLVYTRIVCPPERRRAAGWQAWLRPKTPPLPDDRPPLWPACTDQSGFTLAPALPPIGGTDKSLTVE